MKVINETKDLILDIGGPIEVVPKYANGEYAEVTLDGDFLTVGGNPMPLNQITEPTFTSPSQLVQRVYRWIHEVDNLVANTDLIDVPLEVVEASTVGTTGDGKRYFQIGPKLHNTELIGIRPMHITAGSGSDTDITLQKQRPASASTWTTTEIVSTTCNIEIKDGEAWGYDKDVIDANGDAATYSSAAYPCIDPQEAKMLLNDRLKINIDSWMTGAEGLTLLLTFRPL